jgi:hypothetical protein
MAVKVKRFWQKRQIFLKVLRGGNGEWQIGGGMLGDGVE